MSILLSGDFHANAVNELEIITKTALQKKYPRKKYDGIKYHVILGDAGFLWHGNHYNDIKNYEVLSNRPFPILCVIGNHEPILGKSGLPETDIGIGEKVIKINSEPFVAYLKRGKVYTIDGIKFLVLGGALSIDKDWRKPNIEWWANEYWSKKEQEALFKLLEIDNTFDCVLSHTGPNRINKILFEYSGNSDKLINDEVARLNDHVDASIKCKKWFCGHWHCDILHESSEKKREYQYLYRTTKILDCVKGKLKVYNENDGKREPDDFKELFGDFNT